MNREAGHEPKFQQSSPIPAEENSQALRNANNHKSIHKYEVQKKDCNSNSRDGVDTHTVSTLKQKTQQLILS